MSNKQGNAIQRVIDGFLTGKKYTKRQLVDITGDDSSRVLNTIRNHKHVPIVLARVAGEAYWYMEPEDIHLYQTERGKQKRMVKANAKTQSLKRLAKRHLNTLSGADAHEYIELLGKGVRGS
ncbi:hypothetical protein [Vibrio brasiliensis]|uniref:Uncharacterized protein n=1 Tax=Vibrio brasiliensis LMG 20546 TaxID=945543 RepID=E8LYR5_9VIBR|nr:hypothetical protein [Vibrio brasiliensis]EGA64179.1 hypothetical protein VIBR0546_02544 [Vibrio brasiliensis LMG 20546]